MSSGFKEGLTLGINGVEDTWRTASKVGKGFAVVNIVANAVDVVLGQIESHEIAVGAGIKVGSVSYVANQVAGLGVDLSKAAVTTAVGSVAGVVVTGALAGLAAPAIATVVGVVAAGFIAYQAGKLLDGVTEGAKKKMAKGLKSASDAISGWFEDLSNNFAEGVFP